MKNKINKSLLESYRNKLRILLENDLSRAETILSIKYLNEELVKQSENISELLGKNILIISDQLSKEWNREVSKRFSDTVARSLNEVLEKIRNTRNEINNFLNYLEGNESIDSVLSDKDENEVFSSAEEDFEVHDSELESEMSGNDENKQDLNLDFEDNLESFTDKNKKNSQNEEKNLDDSKISNKHPAKKVAVNTVVSSRKRR